MVLREGVPPLPTLVLGSPLTLTSIVTDGNMLSHGHQKKKKEEEKEKKQEEKDNKRKDAYFINIIINNNTIIG